MLTPWNSNFPWLLEDYCLWVLILILWPCVFPTHVWILSLLFTDWNFPGCLLVLNWFSRHWNGFNCCLYADGSSTWRICLGLSADLNIQSYGYLKYYMSETKPMICSKSLFLLFCCPWTWQSGRSLKPLVLYLLHSISSPIPDQNLQSFPELSSFPPKYFSNIFSTAGFQASSPLASSLLSQPPAS